MSCNTGLVVGVRVIVSGKRAVVQAYTKQARVSQNGSCRIIRSPRCMQMTAGMQDEEHRWLPDLVGWLHLLRES